MRGVHLVQRPVLRFVEDVSQKHHVTTTRAHAVNVSELHMKLVDRPVCRPRVTEVHERSQQLLEMIVLTRIHLNKCHAHHMR